MIIVLEVYREENESLIGDVKNKNKGTDHREKDEIKAITYSDQQIKGSSENHGGKILTPPNEEADGMAVQGMDEHHKHKIVVIN